MSFAAKLRRSQPEIKITVLESGNYVSFGNCGIPYFVGGFFDNFEQMLLRSPEDFRRQGINMLMEHRDTAVDSQAKVVTALHRDRELEISYDKLLVASGSQAIMPPWPGVELGNVHSMKSPEDALLLKDKLKDESIRNVVVVGGGYIGLEAVEAFLKLGKKVALVDLAETLLQRSFDSELSAEMTAQLEEGGVQLCLGEKVLELRGSERVRELVSSKQRLAADLVLVGAGVRPNTSFLGDEFIKLDNGALLVDACGETSVPGAFAIGDCATVHHAVTGKAEYVPLATLANKFARVVAGNIVGKQQEYRSFVASTAVKVLELEAACAGLNEAAAQQAGIDYGCVLIKDKNQTDYYPDQQDLQLKLLYRKSDKVLIGGQILGKKGAVLRMNALALAIAQQMTGPELALADFCYAPPFSRTWDTLNIAGNAIK